MEEGASVERASSWRKPMPGHHHGPLDMQEPLGAATNRVSQYGAGVCVHVNNPSAEVFLKDGSLNAGP